MSEVPLDQGKKQAEVGKEWEEGGSPQSTLPALGSDLCSRPQEDNPSDQTKVAKPGFGKEQREVPGMQWAEGVIGRN